MRRIFVLVAVALVVTACGQMPDPTPAHAPTEAPSSPAPTETSGGTPTAKLTLGDLAARSNAAWSDVRSFRVTFRGEIGSSATGTPAVATPVGRTGATPVPTGTTGFVSIRDVILPDQQRQEVTGRGQSDHLAIVSGNQLFVRGPLVGEIVPGAPADVWVKIDPETLPEDSALSLMLGGLPAPPNAPLSTIPERLWPQVVRHVETVEFDGRDCIVYAAADTVPATGSRVDYAIALDQNDLPCFIETSTAGATVGRDEYTQINTEFAIATPAAATPVSVPPALASPVPHD